MRVSRAWWVTIGVVALGITAILLRIHGPSGLAWLPGCAFHRFTGCYCPGCGMTRAAHASLHGDLVTAFRFNPVGMILLPMALVGIGMEIIGWVRGRRLPVRLRIGSRSAWMIVWVILLFWVLRNIPAWPFTCLAPPV